MTREPKPPEGAVVKVIHRKLAAGRRIEYLRPGESFYASYDGPSAVTVEAVAEAEPDEADGGE